MKLRFLIIANLLLLWAFCITASDRTLLSPTDSTLSITDSSKFVKSNQFYDQLLHKTKKADIKSLFLKSIFVGSDWKNPNSESNQLIEEIDYFKKYGQKKIRNILIFRSNIINGNDSLRNPIEKWHILTRQYIIRRNLFFKAGQTLQPEEMVRNQQFLRSLRFLSDAYIIVQPIDEKEVDVIVYTRDNLSLAPGMISLGNKQIYSFAAESNIFGTGNKFEIGTILSPSSPVYGGFKTEYQFQNIASTFFNLDVLASKNKTDENHHLSFNKNFILPTDVAGGITYEIKRYHEYQHSSDTIIELRAKSLEIWAGKSFTINPKFGSFYLSGLWNDSRFSTPSPEISNLNVNYQIRKQLLFSTGFYHENFYRGNLIYGFGRNEDIPYGYKIEAIGGYSWGEFRNRWYVGTKLQIANMTHYGYSNGKIEFGSFFNKENNRYEQSVLSIENSYFTKLIPSGNWAFRCFFTGKYSHGFNRLSGEGEQLYLNSSTSPRSIHDFRSAGLNRLMLSTETVGFSPLYIYNFRFAFYGFADWAWLGNSSNVFKNDQFTSVGLGVRIKNERLIFQTIQLRIGFAVRNPSNASTNWLDVSEEARMKSDRLIPTKADVVEYK